MGGDSGGAAVRGQAQTGTQGAAEQETAAAQVAAGRADGAAGDGAGGAAAAGVGGAASSAGAMAEAGGDAAGKARADYEKALAERDARIAELEAGIAEAAKTAEGAEALRAEMDELRRQGEEQRVSFELQLAGARNVKAATALLPDYDNDIEKLKEAEPWLFADAAPRHTGKTGLPNAGAASDEGKTVRRWREIAGLPAEKDGE